MEEEEMKEIKSELSKKILFILPIVEEITEVNHAPFCLIGVNHDGDKKILFHFATIDNKKVTHNLLYEACKAYIIKFEEDKI